MAVRTKQLVYFIAPAQGDLLDTLVYTVPVGHRTILKTVHVNLGSNINQHRWVLNINPVATRIGLLKDLSGPTPEPQQLYFERWVVLDAGQSLWTQITYSPAPIGNTLRLVVSGTELEL